MDNILKFCSKVLGHQSKLVEEKVVSEDSKNYKASTFDIWALGITIVIGGQYFSWNFGLAAGLGNFFISTFLVSTAYICLCLCTSELSSALPFAGGAYGLARCTLGFCPGFIIGCCETFEYIIYVAVSATTLGAMIAEIFSISTTVQPLIWLLFYVSALMIHIKGGIFFWRFNAIIAVISIFIVAIYVIGSLQWVDFDKNAVSSDGDWFIGGYTNFFQLMPLAAWFFVGIEGLNMACEDTDEPKIKIPRGQTSCILTLFITAISVIFVCISLPTGMDTLASDLFPLNYGFMQIFNITYSTATLFSLPATYATAFGFIYSYGKLITAMSKSKLLPPICDKKTEKNGTPYAALIAGSIIGYMICLLVYFIPFIGLHLFSICMLSACTAYIAQCIGYIQLQTRFGNLPRKFRSPLGTVGAVYSMLVWMMLFISLVAFQDTYFDIIVFSGIISIVGIYYYFFARKNQTFSEEEKKILFVAHVINNNNNRRKNLQHRSSNQSALSVQDNKRSSIILAMPKLSKVHIAIVDSPQDNIIDSKFSNILSEEKNSEIFTEDHIGFTRNNNKYSSQTAVSTETLPSSNYSLTTTIDDVLNKDSSFHTLGGGDRSFKNNHLFKKSFKRQLSNVSRDLMEVKEVNEDVSVHGGAPNN